MTNTFARGLSGTFETAEPRGAAPGHDASAKFKHRFAHYVRRPMQRALPVAFGASVVTAVIAGFLVRGEHHITPEEGAGYWLGIVGAVMMMLLMLYPLRKRYPGMRVLGTVGSWFRMHMVLGVLGPTLILFHANFHLSSVNATAATLSMLLVVASGLVGRYLYSRVHLGLYGRTAEISDLFDDIAQIESEILNRSGDDQAFVARFRQIEALLPPPDANALRSLRSAMTMRRAARRTVSELSRQSEAVIKARARQEHWTRRQVRQAVTDVRYRLAVLRQALQKTAALAFYTRMFALWHVLHLPLFVLLIATAILHVVAVHLY